MTRRAIGEYARTAAVLADCGVVWPDELVVELEQFPLGIAMLVIRDVVADGPLESRLALQLVMRLAGCGRRTAQEAASQLGVAARDGKKRIWRWPS